MAGDELGAYDDMLSRCLTRAEGMRKLIEDLLDMTRIESGEKTRQLDDVDVVAVARLAVDGLQLEAEKRSIAMNVSAPERLEMVADRGEIEIILNNLLSNALKYNREEGRVDLRLDVDDDQVTIEVADTGIGMTPSEASRLFHDFARIKNERTRDILGSGLGLSIVKKLALLYGGDVSVTSEPDVGSTFTVVLNEPKLDEPPASAAAEDED